MKAVSEKELVLALAGVHGLKKLSVLASSYTADSIEKALTPKKSKKMLDLGWYVDELLRLYVDPDEKNKVSILNCLRELMFLGAIQDKIVLGKIMAATAPEAANLKFDPFAAKPRLRKAN